MSTANRTKHSTLAKKGLAMRRKVHDPEYVKNFMGQADDFMMMFHNTTNEFCWGSIWTRSVLPIKQRTALTLAITAALSQTAAVKMHTRTALRAGWTKREIGEILLHVYVYAGVYPSLNGFLAAKEVYDELEREAKEKRAAKRKKKGPARHRRTTTLRPQ